MGWVVVNPYRHHFVGRSLNDARCTWCKARYSEKNNPCNESQKVEPPTADELLSHLLDYVDSTRFENLIKNWTNEEDYGFIGRASLVKEIKSAIQRESDKCFGKENFYN